MQFRFSSTTDTKSDADFILISNQWRELMSVELSIISRKDLCKKIGVSADTIRKWIREREFPSPLPQSGREPFFDIEEVQRWLFKHKESHNE